MLYDVMSRIWSRRWPASICNTLHHDILYILDMNCWGRHTHAQHINYHNTYINKNVVYIYRYSYRYSPMIGWPSVCKATVWMMSYNSWNCSLNGWNYLWGLLSRLFDLSSTIITIRICDLKSNMGRHRLITSQWCKPLIGTRETTDDDNVSQGTVVQSAWRE